MIHPKQINEMFPMGLDFFFVIIGLSLRSVSHLHTHTIKLDEIEKSNNIAIKFMMT